MKGRKAAPPTGTVPAPEGEQSTCETIIRNGRVMDGTGNPWRKADVGIIADRIVAIGDLSAAGSGSAKTIDATGCIVGPGFIDMHSHSDVAFLINPVVEPKIRQGITTEVVGQDGIAAAPMAPSTSSGGAATCPASTAIPVSWAWLNRRLPRCA